MNFFAYEVSLHMKSGEVLSGYVTKLGRRTNGSDLSELTWNGDMPFYFRLDDISAVTMRRVINWRKLFR